MRALSPRTVTALGIAVGLLVVVIAWFLLVSPWRSEASDLADRIAETETELAERRAQRSVGPVEPVRVADLFRLTQALPEETGMPELVLGLPREARASGVVLRSIAPEAATVANGYESLPLTIVVRGRYAAVTSFLGRLRRQVVVADGRLRTRGRLFSVGSIALGEAAEAGFPLLDATLTVNAYAFEEVPPVPVATSEPAPAEPSGESASAAPGGTP